MSKEQDVGSRKIHRDVVANAKGPASVASNESAPAFLPGGLRDGVCAHMARSHSAEPYMALALKNAARGIPNSVEQENRWRRLGLI